MAKTATRKMSGNFFGHGFDRILRRVLLVLIVSLLTLVSGFLLWGTAVLMWHSFMPLSWHFLASEKIDDILIGVTGMFIGMFVLFLFSVVKR